MPSNNLLKLHYKRKINQYLVKFLCWQCMLRLAREVGVSSINFLKAWQDAIFCLIVVQQLLARWSVLINLKFWFLKFLICSSDFNFSNSILLFSFKFAHLSFH